MSKLNGLMPNNKLLATVLLLASVSSLAHIPYASATENDDRSIGEKYDQSIAGENEDRTEGGQNEDRSVGEKHDQSDRDYDDDSD